ncbi:hypothetical protein GGR21_003327 [Dysgonomonas hofstadii]|uniref:Uncharacterized protein n=1 Tax=Dysgonomonas hofstadii TaxID=637886 RepID=A0A840CN35_9BACT|nr:hypothetical protein [Dysgonomonas hofstadii]MBB4037410.1 hypothetical protein [Dysgonomonas hofstadii]
MRADDYAKLEKDIKFKKSYLSNTTWWKDGAIIAPIVLMFGGLVGILYLFNMDKLISISAIPYLLLFAVGTILFKAIKMNLQKRKMAEPGAFHICVAVPVGEENGYTYAVFTNDTHRYNKHYIKNIAKETLLDSIPETDKITCRKKTILAERPEQGDKYCIRAYKTKDINKQNINWRNDDYFPVLFIDENNTPVIKSKDIK